MKITMVLLTCCLLQLSAATYGQRITLNRPASPIPTVLEEIRKQTGYDFFYDADAFDGAAKIAVNIRNADIEQALSVCFSELPYTYTIRKKIVTIKRKTMPANVVAREGQARQQSAVRGKVIDAQSNLPMPGVSVRIKSRPQTSLEMPSLAIRWLTIGETR